ncbi:MAG TPA: AI-2E family transporter, partial [Rectinemataceae bacterium]|nr:AI-2E family transporter [Rectinemataceae bacterium]
MATDGSRMRRYLFIGLFIGLLLLVLRLFYPFMTVFIWSGILFAILSPLQRFALRRLGAEESEGMRRLVSVILAVGGVVLVVLPLGYLAGSLAHQVIELSRAVRSSLSSDPSILDLSPSSQIGGFVYRLTDGLVDLSRVNIGQELAKFLYGSGNRLLGLSGVFLQKTFSLVLGLVFLAITLYFFLMDGRHLMSVLVGSIPIEREYTILFISKLQSSTRDLARGYLLVMGIIATVMTAVFAAFHVRGFLLFGVLTALSTFVPVAGPALALLPVAAIEAITSGLPSAALLLLIGISVVTFTDSVIRPFLLKDRLEMHPLLVLFSILGGIEVFG